MFELLRTWINGKKNFYEGIVLYSKTIGNDAFFMILSKGETVFNRKKLDAKLLEQFYILKAGHVETPVNILPKISPEVIIAPDTFLTSDLYKACKAEALNIYKEAMNKRAILFNMAKVEPYQDPNENDKPRTRAQFALDAVILYNKSSSLFDRADYVAKHGHLPTDDITSIDEEYQDLSDHLVKQTLDNLRKNVAKMKKREQTADRIALQEKHSANILKLEARWLSLKP